MQTLRMSGWLSAKVDDLKTATAADTNSEDPGNIDHYYNLMGAGAPVATILYVAKVDMYEGKPTLYFLKATNMPHTHEIYNNKLTPYCVKATDASTGPAQIHARGYGAILPFMYNRGVTNIQWENADGSFSQIITDVDAQITAAKNGTDDVNLPKPSYTKDMTTLGRGAQRFHNDVQLWGANTVQLFKDLGIKTWEVAINPSFNGREDLVRSQRQFQHYLECLQTQFEDAIHAEKLKIVGIFLGEEEKVYESPYPFHKENTTAFDDIEEPITTSGRYNLLDEFSIECMAFDTVEVSVNPVLFARYTRKATGDVSFYKWTSAGGNGNYKSQLLAQPVENFITDFDVTYGRSPAAKRYADVLRTLEKNELHPLQYDSIEKYADGVYVSVSGMRTTLKPIEAGGKKVANTMDHSEQRMFLNIRTKRMKKHIHLQDWKENSRFTNISKPQENPLIFAVQAMQCFQARAFLKQPTRTEDRFIDTLGATAAAMGDGAAATEGRNLEAQFGRLMEREFPDMEHTIGDQAIKRDVLGLPLNSQGNQAVDTLHVSEEDSLWIATQVKSGDRDKDEAFHNFVNTFRLVRERALVRDRARCFGVLIHYKGLKNPSAWEILSKEPGLSVVSRTAGEAKEDFEQRCFDHIHRIKKFY
jgi:hypothetical protein